MRGTWVGQRRGGSCGGFVEGLEPVVPEGMVRGSRSWREGEGMGAAVGVGSGGRGVGEVSV